MGVSPARPVHLRASSVGLVFVGGAVGTLARYLLSGVLPTPAGLPLSILAINVVGAFVLGWLLAALAARGPDAGIRRSLRLLVGTGVCGGFTTYSTLAVGADGLFAARPWEGIAYAVVTVLVGAAASLAGILVAGRRGARV